MKTIQWAAGAALLGALLAPVANAQAPMHHYRHGVIGRQANQDRRIDQGIASGQLTRREAARLNRREYRLDNREDRLRAMNGGHLTGRERGRLERQQNRLSGAIYRQKHDAQVR